MVLNNCNFGEKRLLNPGMGISSSILLQLSGDSVLVCLLFMVLAVPFLSDVYSLWQHEIFYVFLNILTPCADGKLKWLHLAGVSILLLGLSSVLKNLP